MKNWKEKLVDLCEKEMESCVWQKSNKKKECQMNKIIDFVEELLEEEREKLVEKTEYIARQSIDKLLDKIKNL